jgi:CRISPR-associated protein Cmr3
MRAEEPFKDRFADVTLAVRVRAKDWEGPELNIWHPLGGERRLVHWGASRADVRGWECPLGVRTALVSASRVRLVLTTPAIFQHGWRPDWVKPDLTAEPFAGGPKLKLVGVSIPRWRAVSGWSMQPHQNTKKPGPKPVRRMVPAGGIYFFETVRGGAAALADRWLEPVSDDRQDRHDGFGLAAWGVW